jgi:transglutaminase-like putative cysteine protease
MRLSITHEMGYTYDSPVRSSTQYLRLWPRDTARQKVIDWKLDTPGQAMRTQDGYGNVLHVLTLDKPVSEISIAAAGTVETLPKVDESSDFTGTPLSPLLFLRPTALTRADAKIESLTEPLRRQPVSLSGLRELARAIDASVDGKSNDDVVHAFISCCQRLGVPARYVSGYFYSPGAGAAAIQAWAEAWVLERWRSFDVAHDAPVGEAHVKIAIGADYLDACPIRGVRIGGGTETLLAQAHVMAANQ